MVNKLDNVKVQTTVGSSYAAKLKELAALEGITISAMYRKAIEIYCADRYAEVLAFHQNKNNGS